MHMSSPHGNFCENVMISPKSSFRRFRTDTLCTREACAARSTVTLTPCKRATTMTTAATMTIGSRPINKPRENANFNKTLASRTVGAIITLRVVLPRCGCTVEFLFEIAASSGSAATRARDVILRI